MSEVQEPVVEEAPVEEETQQKKKGVDHAKYH